MCLCFYFFGYGLELEVVVYLDDGGDDGYVVGVFWGVGYKGLVDFEFVDGIVFEVG